MKNLSDFLNVQESEMILEMAKLNLKEDSISLFPSNKYRIWVQGDNSPDIPAHLHISCSEESLELKVYIETCEIWAVVSKRKRISKKPEELQDIIKKLKEWFTLQTTMTGRIGTNKETAYNEWVACNEQ
jgi:hypothetical protein